MGSNCNGLSGKGDSLMNSVKFFKPSCINLQETKLRSKKYVIPGYQVFLKNREGYGGGLLTAVDDNLSPVLVSSPESEILVIQADVSGQSVRIINGYGPQEDANPQDVHNFWQSLEKEIISAKNQNCKILIQLDANAKIGKENLAGDPNMKSNNGHILLEIIKRQNLCILNTENKCQGVITRQRNTVKGSELSVLDYIIVCQELKQYFNEMIIDEERAHVLTKYVSAKGRQRKIESDHNVLVGRFMLSYRKMRGAIKREMFNFRNTECQKKKKLKSQTAHQNYPDVLTMLAVLKNSQINSLKL